MLLLRTDGALGASAEPDARSRPGLSFGPGHGDRDGGSLGPRGRHQFDIDGTFVRYRNEDRGQVVMRRIYLAGPEVFLPDAVEIGFRKKALCQRYGFVGLFPFDNEVPGASDGSMSDRAIYRANVELMRSADMAIVNLTPFRGPSADAGSVFELGMMAGLGKPVLGYTNVAGSLADRTTRLFPGTARDHQGILRDPAGMSVEDFGNSDNLMIDCCLIETGHPIVRQEICEADGFRDLTGFESCLKLAFSDVERRGGDE